ncbi:hypothetical protein, partial [Klebsiella aerogenes]|uniref:hypothetical protein n=1 Tax=Klebsiella aerogenes TaxID=548 RepID=UPI0021E135A7
MAIMKLDMHVYFHLSHYTSLHEVQDAAGAHHWFLFKKINMLTCSGVSLVRSLLTVRPAVEKTRSDGTDVPGMHKYP